MDKRFVQVEYKGFAASKLRRLRWDHGVLLGDRLLAKSACTLQLQQLLLCEVKLSFEKHLCGLGCHRGCLSSSILLLLLLVLVLIRIALVISILDHDLVLVLGASFLGGTCGFAHANLLVTTHLFK